MRPGRSALEAILEDCGISLTSAQLDQLWAYHQLLRAANERLNLTRIHNFENMVLKHYVDSLLVLNFMDLPSPLIDMGSGPGLPGIPLKIARPDVEMILAEPRGTRVGFLNDVCAQLGLQGVNLYAHKLGPGYPGQVSGVISRAVAEIPITLDRVASCLAPAGKMIFMKGPDCDAEIAAARHECADLFRLQADHAYAIPGTSHERRLVVYERLNADVPVRSRRPEPARAFVGAVREVSSDSNATFRTFVDLLTGRGIRRHGQALFAGPRIVAEILERFPERAKGWITDEGGAPPPSSQLTWYRLARPLFQTVDSAGTNAPLLLVDAPAPPQWSPEAEWPDGCTLFVPFQDPENVGAIIRSAAAFGVPRLVLLKEAAHPFHPRSARAAGPALLQVPLLQGPSIQDLQAETVPILALDTSGPEVSATPFPGRFGLLVGVEGPGLPEHWRAGERRRVAMAPEVESLNAATAGAIALYVWSQQRAAKTE